MGNKIYNVLFLCTGNSARSIIAEAILKEKGKGRFESYSAGSNPTGQVNPYSIKHLKSIGIDTSFARSKTWDEFESEGAPKMDFIFTVCDSAANETCPVWPGNPASAHWGIPDPASATGSDDEISRAFATAYEQMDNRISAFLKLPIDDLSASELKQELKAIGAKS